MTTTAPPSTTTDQETWDEKIARLRGRKPNERTVRIPDEDAQAETMKARLIVTSARASVRARLDDADQEISDAAVAADPLVQEAEAAYAEARQREEQLEIRWPFRALPPDVFDTFLLDYPPTDEQRALGMAYDPTTYVPALISACSVNPVTAETIQEMTASAVLNQGDMGLLVKACLEVNSKTSATLGKG